MFAIEMNTIFRRIYLCSVQSTYFSNKVLPGARKRLKIIDEDEIDLDNLDFEANFENLNLSHKDHLIQMGKEKEKLQSLIVRQKYFKTKYPNFLTWNDKEQIRILHRKDPETWSVSKLSEGFPALPDIIKKIIKSNWKMESLERIKKHDESVQENWRKFKSGELANIPETLSEHLKKFTNREVNFRSYEEVEIGNKIEITATHKCTEFSEIISSYERLKNNSSENENKKKMEVNFKNRKRIDEPSNKLEEDTYVDGPIRNKKLITLDVLKNQLKTDEAKGKYLSLIDADIVLNDSIERKVENSPAKIDNQVDVLKYNTGKIMVIDDKTKRDYDHLCYPEKIHIPRDILKRGYTYKLNDCYYDSDGKFLYRTPGLYSEISRNI